MAALITEAQRRKLAHQAHTEMSDCRAFLSPSGPWHLASLLLTKHQQSRKKHAPKHFIGGDRKLPQIWCDFLGQVGFKLKTLFPCPSLPCPSVSASQRKPQPGLAGSPVLPSPAGFLSPPPAVRGAPGRWFALISRLQARGGILRSHVTFWREEDLVNKHSPHRGRGQEGGKESLTFGDGARIKGHRA